MPADGLAQTHEILDLKAGITDRHLHLTQVAPIHENMEYGAITGRSAASENTRARKPLNSFGDISPAAIANSRNGLDETWPRLGTLYGGSVTICVATSSPSSTS